MSSSGSAPWHLSNFGGAKILCVMAHPDDEVLGCGGTLARASSAGADIKVLLPIQRTDFTGRDAWHSVMDQFRRSVEYLGGLAIIPDSIPLEDDLVSPSQILPFIEPLVDWCDVVFTHSNVDVHQTHRAISHAVEISTRPFRRRRTVLQCEILSSTDQSFAYSFSPNLFVSIDEIHLGRKLEALNCYPNEITYGRNPRNVRRLAELRGDQIAVDFAEAFYIARAFI